MDVNAVFWGGGVNRWGKYEGSMRLFLEQAA